MSVPLKIILKISHQLQYLATATMPVYQRMVVKFSLLAIVKRIRRIDFNKYLSNGKAYFYSFSGPTKRENSFVCEGFIVKENKNFETENAETVCLELLLVKKKWCTLFVYQPPDTNLYNEIYIILNKILGKYDNILLARDLNIDELKTDSNSSNHLSDAKDVFNFTNLVKKSACFKSQNGTLFDLMLTNRPRSFLKS